MRHSRSEAKYSMRPGPANRNVHGLEAIVGWVELFDETQHFSLNEHRVLLGSREVARPNLRIHGELTIRRPAGVKLRLSRPGTLGSVATMGRGLQSAWAARSLLGARRKFHKKKNQIVRMARHGRARRAARDAHRTRMVTGCGRTGRR